MLESKWGLRFVALILALLMFLSVNNVFGSLFSENALKSSDHIIEDVPVDTIYNTKELYLSGAPKTVDVKVSGPQSTILQAEKLLNFKVELDLKNKSVGQYKENFKIKGLSDELKATVVPKSANVTLQDKVSKKYPIEAEINQNRIASGYELVGETVNPSQVTITGGQEELNKIAYVKATLDETKQLTDDTTEKAGISVLDSNLNKLDVQIRPDTVNVNIKVARSSKTVTLNPVTKGSASKNINIDDITLDKTEVKIYGSRNVLDGIGSIDVPVDVSNVDGNTTKKVDLSLPDGVDEAEFKDVEAKIETSKN
ncbi:CdaR family protein [Mammaliicoccus sciuri]|uniref:CdaR family protein n=1 Tax=Mammaliicoccus sciuri TaxID=1296 RepID=UPI0021D3929A|nr:CdaR family protein [Mammaliicoccus sciuri]UXU84273.1 CdaR family protein [Mammaliicoccus sciuri]UXU94123.1 CdaR family protein [Mammaliicoccus sciuri]UXV16072.1 CdaR family protein [Mammaliicoccus sciuri]UXV24332.1 CdaR family protein [Mammaliicoccus sciuri]UXV27114.1 CdaR family protein [Mammaliicoccus sciuri]